MGVRPTPNRVRETLFNWIQGDVHGSRCLDLFAGSGALGFEALSRGAARVVAVEHDPSVVAYLARTAQELGAGSHSVVCADASQYLNEYHGETLDFIFIDPPFGQGWLDRILPTLTITPACGAGTRIYLECGQTMQHALATSGWKTLKLGRAGRVYYALAQKDPSWAG